MQDAGGNEYPHPMNYIHSLFVYLALVCIIPPRALVFVRIGIDANTSRASLGLTRWNLDDASPETSSHLVDHYREAAYCALRLEQRWAPGFDKVVWLAMSDQVALRKTIVNDFDESDLEGGRTVITTSSHGRHSRPNVMRGPDAQDFKVARRHGTHVPLESAKYHQSVVEGLADWWLLGEADLVIIGQWENTDGGTFPRLAAARTGRARSVHHAGRAACGADDGHLPMWSDPARSARQ